MYDQRWAVVGGDGKVWEWALSREDAERTLRRGYIQDGYDGIGPLRYRLPDGCKVVEMEWDGDHWKQ